MIFSRILIALLFGQLMCASHQQTPAKPGAILAASTIKNPETQSTGEQPLLDITGLIPDIQHIIRGYVGELAKINSVSFDVEQATIETDTSAAFSWFDFYGVELNKLEDLYYNENSQLVAVFTNKKIKPVFFEPVSLQIAQSIERVISAKANWDLKACYSFGRVLSPQRFANADYDFVAYSQKYAIRLKGCNNSKIIYIRENSRFFDFFNGLQKLQRVDVIQLPHSAQTFVEHLSGRNPVTRNIKNLAISPDERYFAVGGGEHHQLKYGKCLKNNIISVWDIEKKALVQSFNIEFPPSCCAFSPDGKYLAVGYMRLLDALNLEIFNIATKQSKRLKSDIVHAITFSPDGKYLVTGNDMYHADYPIAAETKKISIYLWDCAVILSENKKLI